MTSQDGNRDTLSLTDSRYQQKVCPWGKENVPDCLGVELYKAGILFHGSSLTSLPLLLLICPESFFFIFFFSPFARDSRSVFSSQYFESISSTISTERKAGCIFHEMMLGFRSLLAIIPGR